MQSPVSLQNSCIAAKHIVSLCTSKLEALKNKVAQGNKKFRVEKQHSVFGEKKNTFKNKAYFYKLPRKFSVPKKVINAKNNSVVTLLYVFILKHLQSQAEESVSHLAARLDFITELPIQKFLGKNSSTTSTASMAVKPQPIKHFLETQICEYTSISI